MNKRLQGIRSIIIAGCASLALVAGLGQAQAVVTIQNAPGGGDIAPFGAPDTATYGQTFTAPITGLMTSFTLWLNGGVGALFGGVGDWNGPSAFGLGHGSPNNLYQSVIVPSVAAGAYTFSPNINVVVGQTYVAYLSAFHVTSAFTTTTMPLAINTVPGINYFVWNNTSNPANNPSWNYFFNAGSAQFAATFTSSVPEPSTWSMMIFGFVALAFAITRRKGARLA